MRIGIDISTILNHGRDIGSGRYIINLLYHLFEIDREDTFVLTGRYITDENLYLVDEIKKHSGKIGSKLEFKLFKTTQKRLDFWNKLGFPTLEMLGFKADILHCPDFLIPPTNNKNIILTIHDLAFMRYPQFNFEWFIKKYTKLVKKNSRTAKKIIADSHSTKNDIMGFLNIDTSRVSVIHLAAEENFKKLSAVELDRGLPLKFNITKKYILSVGTIEPRKNYVTLIRAFNYLKSMKNKNTSDTIANPGIADVDNTRPIPRVSDFNYQLVIVGRTGWLSEAAYSEYESSPYKDEIIFVGRIEDSELVQIYNMAQLFVYPSIFEGFGLPIVEAMQCGLPVLASNTSSIPELVDSKKLLFNPADENEIATKILKISSDENLRTELSQKSIKNASRFSWEKTAQQTLEIYKAAN